VDVVQVEFAADDTVEWVVDGNNAHADKTSPPCAASITIVKSLDPDTDPGKFDLEIDGFVKKAAVGDTEEHRHDCGESSHRRNDAHGR
jgi:hypothetical protein